MRRRVIDNLNKPKTQPKKKEKKGKEEENKGQLDSEQNGSETQAAGSNGKVSIKISTEKVESGEAQSKRGSTIEGSN